MSERIKGIERKIEKYREKKAKRAEKERERKRARGRGGREGKQAEFSQAYSR